mgnify:FL=1
MAQPQYNSIQRIETHADTIGRWKAFMVGGRTAGDVFAATFNGEGITFENVQPNTVMPIGVNKFFDATGRGHRSGATLGNYELWGLN